MLCATQAVADGVNLADLLGCEAAAEVPLVSQEQLDGMLAAVRLSQRQLQAQALEHLTAKLLVSGRMGR